MSSNVTRGGKAIRPTWDHRDSRRTLDAVQLEMLESLRNVCEDISAELQQLNRVFGCHNFQAIPRKLDRISRNTYVAKHGKEPKS